MRILDACRLNADAVALGLPLERVQAPCGCAAEALPYPTSLPGVAGLMFGLTVCCGAHTEADAELAGLETNRLLVECAGEMTVAAVLASYLERLP